VTARRHTRAFHVLSGVAAALGLASSLGAQPVATATELPGGGAADGYAVIDIRSEKACLAATLPGARCLPASWLLANNEGGPIDFHALRWLLGTVGLTGAETLVIYGGAEAAPDDPWAVAALAYLAGQARVLVLDGASPAAKERGESRSFSREAVYTAPMRRGDIVVAGNAAGTPQSRLADFARAGGAYVFVPQS
jgi:3-mercaptopyruvate sulfurtransferase SseA